MSILQDAWDTNTNTLVMVYNQELGKTIGLPDLIKRVQVTNNITVFSQDSPNSLTFVPHLREHFTTSNTIDELRELWLSQVCYYECDFDTNLLIFGVVHIGPHKLLYCYGQRTEVIKITDKPSTISLMKAVQASEEMLGLYSVEANDFNFSKFMANKSGVAENGT